MMTQITAEPTPIGIDLSRTALIIIDMQRDFLEPGGSARRSATMSVCSNPPSSRAAKFWRRARKAGILVIHTARVTAPI